MIIGSIFALSLSVYVLRKGLKTKEVKLFIFTVISLLASFLFFMNAFFAE
jgi:hypothetical protein